MDGGSVERWEDENYRNVYKDILTGNWEAFDAWNMGECDARLRFVLTAQNTEHSRTRTCTMVPDR
jgi:hypothetical protein